MKDISNFKLLKAVVKLKTYKRRRDIHSVIGNKYNAGNNDPDCDNEINLIKKNDISCTYSHYWCCYSATFYQTNQSSSGSDYPNSTFTSSSMFGIVTIKSYLRQLIHFVKIRSDSQFVVQWIVSEVLKKHAIKVFSYLKLNVMYNKKRYINRLREFSSLYIRMLYYDYKKRINRKNSIVAREKAAIADSTNYNTRLVIKYVGKWGVYVANRISNRLNIRGGHTYLR